MHARGHPPGGCSASRVAGQWVLLILRALGEPTGPAQAAAPTNPASSAQLAHPGSHVVGWGGRSPSGPTVLATVLQPYSLSG